MQVIHLGLCKRVPPLKYTDCLICRINLYQHLREERVCFIRYKSLYGESLGSSWRILYL